ncbi:DUF421 domain-containing protein [Adhaeribacter swui]|uniref:DUF421 domain-containing protein n=1 Tax=Adhaeribacter swui TaxID=2086471 RepID=A0A7G7G6U9_9BACT|nr:YetF domain-containing protein [Adhaeribacter swui]QNF32883.1 DUF421 domain-containing protein [Adhaeribacter swui]
MKDVVPFDWTRIFIHDELPLGFLGEIAFRSALMYVFVLITLRVMGRRGIKQLSLFEFSIILALGSSAGDPMFYEDVPIGHALVVFVVVILLYVFFNYLTEKVEPVERWLEGRAVCIIEDGVINLSNFKKQNLTYHELFGEIRQYQVEHLGQVRKVYLEATGEISTYFFTDEEVKPGLPIFPELLTTATDKIEQEGEYACRSCGQVQKLPRGEQQPCTRCQHNLWLKACSTKRIT